MIAPNALALSLRASKTRPLHHISLLKIGRTYSQAKKARRASGSHKGHELTDAPQLAANAKSPAGPKEPPPLYERKPEWYVRWMWVLLGANVIWTGNAAELTWNRWTERNPETESTSDDEYVPRPIWQRAALTGFILLGGLAVSGGLLLTRSRQITRLRLHDNKLTIQTWTEWGSKGKVVEKRLCSLQAAGRDAEMTLRVPGVRGTYRLALKDASVNGRPGGVWDVKKRLHESWYGVTLRGKWVAGSPAGEWS